MKNISITIILSSILLCSCGGSEGGTTTKVPKKDFIANLSNTSWIKTCFPYHDFSNDDSTVVWYAEVKLSIDSSLKSTYRTKFYHPTDTECQSMMFDGLDISRFDITGKVISEESVAAYGLDETFIYHSDKSDLSVNYTLIYRDGEKLYFGHQSGSNLGETSKTRHSSISLDDYFTQVIN